MLNVYDGFNGRKKLEFLGTKVLPHFQDLCRRCFVIVDAFIVRKEICLQRYTDCTRIEGRKFYAEQLFRIFETAYAECILLQTGKVKIDHHIHQHEAFQHCRTKEAYRYKLKGNEFLSLCSLDGLKFEIRDLESRVQGAELKALASEVDVLEETLISVVDNFFNTMKSFVYAISGLYLERPKDSLVLKGLFECTIKMGDKSDRITFILKDKPKFPLSCLTGDVLIDEYEEAPVQKRGRSSGNATRIDDDVPAETLAAPTESVSINSIKAQCGYIDPSNERLSRVDVDLTLPSVESYLPPPPPPQCHLEILLQIKYSELTAENTLVKKSKHHVLKIWNATEVPRTYDKLIQLLLEDSWAEMLIPREILLGDTPLEPDVDLDKHTTGLVAHCRRKSMLAAQVFQAITDEEMKSLRPMPLVFLHHIEDTLDAFNLSAAVELDMTEWFGFELAGHHSAGLSKLLAAIKLIAKRPIDATLCSPVDGAVLATFLIHCSSVRTSCGLRPADFGAAASIFENSSDLSIRSVAFECDILVDHVKSGDVAACVEDSHAARFLMALLTRSPQLQHLDLSNTFAASTAQSYYNSVEALLMCLTKACNARNKKGYPPLTTLRISGLDDEYDSALCSIIDRFKNSMLADRHLPIAVDFSGDPLMKTLLFSGHVVINLTSVP